MTNHPNRKCRAFTLRVEMNNAAFEDQPVTELTRILYEVGVSLETGRLKGNVRDSNGNTVGRFACT